MNLQDEFKLTYLDKNEDLKDLAFKFKVPSASVKIKLDEIQELLIGKMQEMTAKIEKIQSKTDKIQKDDTLGEDEKALKLMEDKKLIIEATKLYSEMSLMTMNSYVDKFKAIVLTKNLTTDKKELFNQEATQDFWQSVNHTQIKEAVDFFTALY